MPESLEGTISEADLVIAATDDDHLNEHLTGISQKNKTLVNKVDDLSTKVMVPSVVDVGDIVISISTGGKSPAMCKFLRLKIEDWLDESYAEMVKIQNEIKDELKGNIDNQAKRGEILWNILYNDEIWETLREDLEAGRDLALKKAREMVN